MSPETASAWEAFRFALNRLAQQDEQRARLYLEGAAGALRGYARSLDPISRPRPTESPFKLGGGGE